MLPSFEGGRLVIGGFFLALLLTVHAVLVGGVVLTVTAR
jgi:hypothetical protein